MWLTHNRNQTSSKQSSFVLVLFITTWVPTDAGVLAMSQLPSVFQTQGFSVMLGTFFTSIYPHSSCPPLCRSTHNTLSAQSGLPTPCFISRVPAWLFLTCPHHLADMVEHLVNTLGPGIFCDGVDWFCRTQRGKELHRGFWKSSCENPSHCLRWWEGRERHGLSMTALLAQEIGLPFFACCPWQ